MPKYLYRNREEGIYIIYVKTPINISLGFKNENKSGTHVLTCWENLLCPQVIFRAHQERNLWNNWVLYCICGSVLTPDDKEERICSLWSSCNRNHMICLRKSEENETTQGNYIPLWALGREAGCGSALSDLFISHSWASSSSAVFNLQLTSLVLWKALIPLQDCSWSLFLTRGLCLQLSLSMFQLSGNLSIRVDFVNLG